MITKDNTVLLPNTDKDKVFSHLEDTYNAFANTVKIDKTAGRPYLLDIGCRNSSIKKLFEDLGYDYIGVDINPLVPGIIKCDMHCTPFSDESFDVVFCSHTFEHTETPLKALKEFSRVSKCGGIIFISTPAYSDYQIFKCDKTHIFVPTSMQMKRFIELAGLRFIKTFYVKHEGCDDRFASLITIAEVIK